MMRRVGSQDAGQILPSVMEEAFEHGREALIKVCSNALIVL